MSFSICFNFCISNEIHFIYCNAITIVKFSSLSQSLTLVFIISVHGQNLLSAYDAWYFLGVGRRNCSVCCLSQIRQGQQLSLAWWISEFTGMTYKSMQNSKAATSPKCTPLWVTTQNSYALQVPPQLVGSNSLLRNCVLLLELWEQ